MPKHSELLHIVGWVCTSQAISLYAVEVYKVLRYFLSGLPFGNNPCNINYQETKCNQCSNGTPIIGIYQDLVTGTGY